MNKNSTELRRKAEILGLEVQYTNWGYGRSWCGRLKNDERLNNPEIRFNGWASFANNSEKALQVIDKFAQDIKKPDFYKIQVDNTNGKESEFMNNDLQNNSFTNEGESSMERNKDKEISIFFGDNFMATESKSRYAVMLDHYSKKFGITEQQAGEAYGKTLQLYNAGKVEKFSGYFAATCKSLAGKEYTPEQTEKHIRYCISKRTDEQLDSFITNIENGERRAYAPYFGISKKEHNELAYNEAKAELEKRYDWNEYMRSNFHNITPADAVNLKNNYCIKDFKCPNHIKGCIHQILYYAETRGVDDEAMKDTSPNFKKIIENYFNKLQQRYKDLKKEPAGLILS